MAEEGPAAPRRRGVHLYLREDVLEALERVAADFDISISRVLEILLAFYLELNSMAEKRCFMADLNSHFRRTP